jgi:hypothetical protein
VASLVYAEPSITFSQVRPWLAGSVPKPISKVDAEDHLTSPAVAGMGQPMAEAEMQREALRQFEVCGHEHPVRLAARRLPFPSPRRPYAAGGECIRELLQGDRPCPPPAAT